MLKHIQVKNLQPQKLQMENIILYGNDKNHSFMKWYDKSRQREKTL